jgi:hypothetical protein
MNRQELLAGYTVKNGRIVDPGKFEGEPVYALAAYDWYMDGGGDTIAGWDTYEITPEDRAEWPELPAEARYIAQSEDDQGFIHTDTWTEEEYQETADEEEYPDDYD